MAHDRKPVTGCLVAGLYNSLEGVDTSKLYTVSIVCHGAQSPRLWLGYLQWMKQKNGNDISAVNLRDKHYGWKALFETVRIGEGFHTMAVFRILFCKNVFCGPRAMNAPLQA